MLFATKQQKTQELQCHDAQCSNNWIGTPASKQTARNINNQQCPIPIVCLELSLWRTIALPITQMNAVLLLGEPMHLHHKVVALTKIMQWCRSLQLLVALSDKVPIYNSKLSMVVEHFRSTLATYYPHGPLNETTWHISCWLCCVFNFHKIKIYTSNSKILNFWPLGHSYCSIVAGYLTCNKMTSFLPSSKVCTWQSTYRPHECRIPQLSGTLLAPPIHFPIITHNFY